MNDTIRRGVAAAALATAVIHLALVGEYFGEAAYLGGLFVAGSASGGRPRGCGAATMPLPGWSQRWCRSG